MTGDIEALREHSFMAHYELDIDILKAAHHGSMTSSTSDFIKHITPKEVFIPAHRMNQFNHPSDSVINRFESLNLEIHRLDLEGTVRVRYFFGEKQKKSFNP